MLRKINKLNVFNISIISALWLSIKTVHDKYNQSFRGERGGRGDKKEFPKWKHEQQKKAILVGSLELLISLPQTELFNLYHIK